MSRPPFRLAGIIAGLVLVAFGIGAIVIGVSGRHEVSTDVKRDTGDVIAKWLSNFEVNTTAHFVGLHGTQDQIDAAQAAAHIQLAEDDGETHSAQVLLYGKDNYARVTYLQSTDEQQQIAHDLPMVA